MQIGVNINQVGNRLNFGQIIFFIKISERLKEDIEVAKK